MSVGHFKKRRAWGAVRLEKMRHLVPRVKGAKELCSFAVVQGKLGGHASHVPLGPVSPLLVT